MRLLPYPDLFGSALHSDPFYMDSGHLHFLEEDKPHMRTIQAATFYQVISFA
jgi:hypothetical protein